MAIQISFNPHEPNDLIWIKDFAGNIKVERKAPVEQPAPASIDVDATPEQQAAITGATVPVEQAVPTASTAPTSEPAHAIDEVQTNPTLMNVVAAMPAPAAIDAKAGVELDANGTPWIKDVHATTKNKTKGGVWKKLRGLDESVLVAAETAARAAIGQTPDAPTDLPAPTAAPETTDLPPPMDFGTLVTKYQEAAQLGVSDEAKFMDLYGIYKTSPKDIGSNETARRHIYNHLCDLIRQASEATALPGQGA